MSSEDSTEKSYNVLNGGAGRETYGIPPSDWHEQSVWDYNTRINEARKSGFDAPTQSSGSATPSICSDSMPKPSCSSDWVGVQPWKTLKALPPKGKLFVFSVFFMLVMYIFPFYSSLFDPNTMYSYEWKKFLRLQLDFSHIIPIIVAVLTALIPTAIVYHSCKKRNDRGAKMSNPLLRVIYYPFAAFTAFALFLALSQAV